MDSKTHVRRRKSKREEEHDEGRWGEGCSLKMEKTFNSEDETAKKLELDVAEALAEFWRMAHEPSQQGKLDPHLRWSCKRRRSSLLIEDSVAPSKIKEEPEDAISSAKNGSSCNLGRDSSLSDRDEIESTRTVKESCQFDSREQSPSSPLPSLQLPRGTFLACGSTTAKSAFHRVLPLVPLQMPCLLPVKSESNDIQLEGFAARPQNVPVRRKSKSSKSMKSKATVKMEPAGEQTIGTRDGEETASQEEMRVKPEVLPVSGLRVLNKAKSALSEKEKEARRLRRIQANRESARQTIRKKQVACAELMKKACSLGLENEGMKQKRECLMQELFCLKRHNFLLKQQLEMGASGNLGVMSTELPLKTSSESISISSSQVPTSPYGVPAHSFAWAMATAAQAVVANQAYTFNNKEQTLDTNHTNSVLQHQTALTGTSRKETASSAVAFMESRTPQSEGAGYNPPSTTPVADLLATDDLPEESACEISTQVNCSLSKPPPTCSSKAGSDAIAVGYKSMECFMSPQIPYYTYDGSSSGYFFSGHSQTSALMGKNYFAAIAAADARRRRKELTRHKISRSPTPKLTTLGDSMKVI